MCLVMVSTGSAIVFNCLSLDNKFLVTKDFEAFLETSIKSMVFKAVRRSKALDHRLDA